MSELDQQIREWVAEACQHPPGSPARQRYLTKVIRSVSGKLWRENVAAYPDAVQQTWVYFCKHICGKYDPTLGSVSTWLNAFLKRRLQDFYIEAQRQRRTEVSSWQTQDGEAVSVVETVPDRDRSILDLEQPLWETVRIWAQTDATGELRATHIKGHPEVNCQVLILRRLLSETSWQQLSEEYQLKIPTLSSFYQRQCLPRLRNFGESEGHINS